MQQERTGGLMRCELSHYGIYYTRGGGGGPGTKGAFTYDVSKILANLTSPVSNCQH